MNLNRPTPGPWVANNAEGGERFGIFDSNGGELAYLFDGTCWFPRVEQGGNPAAMNARKREHEANAYVMMMAPETLRAVQEAIEILRLHGPPDGISDEEAIARMYSIFDNDRMHELCQMFPEKIEIKGV